MKKAAMAAGGLVLLGAIAVLVFGVRQRELERLEIRRQIGELQASVEKDSGLEERVAVLAQERDHLARKVKELEAKQPRPPAAEKGTAEASGSPSLAKKKVPRIKVDPALLQLVRNPAMRQFQEQQMVMVVEREVEEMVAAIGLPGEKREAFQALKLEEYRSRIMPEVDDEGYIVVRERRNFDNEYKELLGAAHYGKYQEYRESLPDRRNVQVVRTALEGSGEPLTPTQNEALLQIYREARKAVNARLKPRDESVREAMTGAVRQQEELQQQVLLRAHGVLTSVQLEALERHYATMLEQQRSALEMVSGMIREEKKP